MRTTTFLGVVFVSFASAQFANGQVFTGLGIDQGSNVSRAEAISEDGRTVVGGSNGPFRWTVGGLRQGFGNAPAGYVLGISRDVSADGSVAVGEMSTGGVTRPWRWTASTGVQEVPGLLRTNTTPRVSADGLTILGDGPSEIIGTRAAKWSAATGVVVAPASLSGLPAGRSGFPLAGGGLSADGSVVVGLGRVSLVPPNTINAPFVWQGSQATALLQGNNFYFSPGGTNATDVSADATVIVGASPFGELWRWTASSGLVTLGTSTAIGPAPPRGSGDGNAAVNGNILWTQSSGTLPLATVLTNAGCSFPGWSNLVATDLSFDGRALCGFGVNPQGLTEAWYATVPGPGGGVVVVVACGGFVARRRR